MPFVAGQKVRAQELNDLVLGVVMTSDVTKISSTSFSNATGLVLPLAANATYGLDGWVHWTSADNADIQFRYTYPSGSTGQWAGVGPRVNENPTASGPRINYVDFGAVSIANSLAFTGDNIASPTTVSASPRGFIITSSTSGNLQLQFAQGTSQASNTVLRAGSWLRVTRLD